MSLATERWIPVLLGALGLWQITADVAQLPRLKAVALATCASPAPKVFSAVQGFETYSTRFTIGYRSPEGAAASLTLTPEVTHRIEGPYNRRNVFGATIAYAPILAASPVMRPIFDSVAQGAFCDPARLMTELGLAEVGAQGPFEIRLDPLPGTNLGDLQTRFVVECP